MLTNKTYGLVISREQRHGTEYVSARIVAREEGSYHPLGVGQSYEWPKHLEGLDIDDLGMDGFISDLNDNQFIGHEVEYRQVYSINASKARRMAKTLDKINRYIDAEKAYEPGDKLVAFAKVLRLEFIAVATTKSAGWRWADRNWLFMSIGEGRNRFRELITEAREAAIEAKPKLTSVA